MKLVIFGATGGTGRLLVEQALEAGHSVTAFVRDPAKLQISHSKLSVVQGDVLDAGAVARAMPGHDAVLSAIGSKSPVRPGVVISEGTRNIVRAMEQAGVRRLISQSSIGFGDSKRSLNNSSFFFRHVIVRFILKNVFAEHARQEDIVKQSELDWVLPRPGNLTDGLRTGIYRHGFSPDEKGLKILISRADVADFMLKQLSDDTYLRKTPALSY